MTRVLIAAGGTGGHVMPALAVARSLRQRGCEVHWLGTDRGIERSIAASQGFPMHRVAVASPRQGTWVARCLALLTLFGAVLRSLAVLRRCKPRVVLGMGGFAAGPAGLAAWLLRVPLLVHEQNSVIGLTNRLLAPFAKKVLTGFPEVGRLPAGSEFVGNPVREALCGCPEPADRGLMPTGVLRLLVLGGSQGATALNRTLPGVVGLLRKSGVDVAVHHQCGRDAEQEVRECYADFQIPARVSVFIDDMAGAYCSADLVVARAGALTVAELCAVGVAAILVPYPHATDRHQLHNARFLADRGGAVLLEQQAMSESALAELILGLLAAHRLPAMAQRARQQARPQAADRVAEYCLELAHA